MGSAPSANAGGGATGEPLWMVGIAVVLVVIGYSWRPTRAVTVWLVAIILLGLLLRTGPLVLSQLHQVVYGPPSKGG